MSGLTSANAELSPTKEEVEDEVTDPAMYLYENTQFHDCVLRVGNPASDKVEQIGVVRSLLMAHSTVFRKLLDKNARSEKNCGITHVTEVHDIKPDVFRLMLKYIYGGQLGELSDISKNTLAELALSANIYNMQPLVKKVCKRLEPTSVDDIFPALQCVSHIKDSILEPHVRKIIQEETDKLFEATEFIELEENIIIFIVLQDRLVVTELELWKAVVKWAENKSKSHPELTIRQILHKPLQYIRLVTLSQDEIINHVMPTNILNPAEIVDLLKAVSKHQFLETPELCSNQEKRAVIKDKADSLCSSYSSELKNIEEAVEVQKSYTYHCEQLCRCEEDLSQSEFIIRTRNKDVELQDFTFKSIARSKLKDPMYFFECTIKFYRSENGIFKENASILIKENVVSDLDITLSFQCKEPLILKKNSTYNFMFKCSPAHPVFSTFVSGYKEKVKNTNINRDVNGHITLQFITLIHLKKITYKV